MSSPTHDISCLLDDGLSKDVRWVSFWFSFFISLVVLLFSMFSYTCWPFASLIGKISLQFFCPFLVSLSVVLLLSCMIFLYSSGINPYLVYSLLIFSETWFADILYHSLCCLFIHTWSLLLLWRGSFNSM